MPVPNIEDNLLVFEKYPRKASVHFFIVPAKGFYERGVIGD